ncbi:hypothetical protein GJ744_008499 [Endocarpon pusillum]|uniref:Uncharacterized protein n=1 Tax=Endocarpon pusillum TaxID=364733 RepID=A0A8H7AH55_9EURO|nr:hypothetical protein GJ744_008499 [Endocarpon pusillum]
MNQALMLRRGSLSRAHHRSRPRAMRLEPTSLPPGSNVPARGGCTSADDPHIPRLPLLSIFIGSKVERV